MSTSTGSSSGRLDFLPLPSPTVPPLHHKRVSAEAPIDGPVWDGSERGLSLGERQCLDRSPHEALFQSQMPCWRLEQELWFLSNVNVTISGQLGSHAADRAGRQLASLVQADPDSLTLGFDPLRTRDTKPQPSDYAQRRSHV